jgi:hypothetical protein
MGHTLKVAIINMHFSNLEIWDRQITDLYFIGTIFVDVKHASQKCIETR